MYCEIKYTILKKLPTNEGLYTHTLATILKKD